MHPPYICSVKLLRHIVDFCLYTFVFIAVCACGLCMATEKLVGGVQPAVVSALHLLIFGSTLVVYNVPFLLHRNANTVGLRARAAVVVMGAVTVATTWPVLGNDCRYLCIFMGALSLAYSLPVLPLKDKKRLRDYGSLKIAVLAGVWTLATCLLPIMAMGKAPITFPFEIALRFIFMFALCLLFDLRDIDEDRRNNIGTVAAKLGIRNGFRVVYAAVSVFLVLSVWQYVRHPAGLRLAGAVVTALAWLPVAKLVWARGTTRIYMVAADGLMLLYSVIVLM